MDSVLEVKGLTKRFADFTAVDDLSFSVPAGSVYGFLGQNGAGKSTTIRMLLTLIEPTAGEILIFGKPLASNRKAVLSKLGAIVEKPDLYKYLNGLEHLRIFSRLSGICPQEAKLKDLLSLVGLGQRLTSRVGTYSQGMRQRLALACALVNDPDLLILDEPTNGLDPQGIADMRQLILQLSKEQGKTIIVSSHLLSEMEMIADQVLIIDKGKKIVEASMETLVQQAASLELQQQPQRRFFLEAYFLSLTTA
ncbi:MAG: ABC transporter ATP-binding protein [Sphingomonadales bacterium]|nr:ABC transporter ATP-binding protein [Sphingomonadales bacterium]